MRALVVRVGLHRSDVGVHEDNLDAFFLKNLDRLLGLGLGLALHGGQHGVGMTLYTPTTLKPINRARLPPHNVKKMPTKKQENPSRYLFPPKQYFYFRFTQLLVPKRRDFSIKTVPIEKRPQIRNPLPATRCNQTLQHVRCSALQSLA